MTFLVRKPVPRGPGTQVFWLLTPAELLNFDLLTDQGQKQRGPWLQPAPALVILLLGCWDSQGPTNCWRQFWRKFYYTAWGGDGGDIFLATGLFTSHVDPRLK